MNGFEKNPKGGFKLEGETNERLNKNQLFGKQETCYCTVFYNLRVFNPEFCRTFLY